MKIPFSIKYRPQIESGEFKVETESGKPAKIFDWEWNNKHVGVCLAVKITEKGEDVGYLYTEYGKRAGIFPYEKDSDLFIVTPEEELSEFILALRNAMADTIALAEGKDDNETSEIADKQAKRYAAELLTIARKEALKDLPRWTTIDNAIVRIPHVGTNMRGESMLYIGENAILISCLMKLPGFKEDESHE